MPDSAPVFDALAAQYDDAFTHSLIGRAQRSEVWYHLQPIVQNGPLDILELSCGTGYDARRLADAGHRVLATDISAAMLEQAKYAAANPHPPIEWLVMDMRKPELGDRKFDLIFSNFGGLNFLSAAELKQLSENLSAHLRPGGKLVLVFIHNFCLWESVYFLLRLRYRTALRRRKGEAEFNGEKIYYYSRKKIKALFSAYRCIASHPIGILTPPSYEEKFVRLIRRQPRLQKGPRRLERALAVIMGADHRMYILEK